MYIHCPEISYSVTITEMYMSQAYSRIRLFAKNLGVLQNGFTLNNNFQFFKMTCRFQSFCKMPDGS
jgi:hypothetical protein